MSEGLLTLLAGDAESKVWVRSHLAYPHEDWCLIWPFGRIQSGYAAFGKPAVAVHRIMCEARHGPPPSPKHHAAHSCGRGHEGCVNPWHLNWRTVSENQKERYQHSGPTRRTKLTLSQVEEILALKDKMRVIDIAHRYGVSDTNIRSIHAGRMWKNTTTLALRIFSEDEVRAIRASTKFQKDIAAEYGSSLNVIHRIKARKTYKHVADTTAMTPQDQK